MRRLRRTETLRGLVRETELSPEHLIQPAFVVAGEGVREDVESMPGVERFSISELVAEATEIGAAGVGAVLLFGLPASKDETGSGAYDEEGVVQMAVRALKEAHPELVVITDVCLCEYTSHGHCGFLRDGEVDNDVTLELLAKTAISHAEAGADAVAPSDMMDGRVGTIRHQLDEEGHSGVPIIAYSAKYASAFYGPFREAADSAPASGDRRGYQLDPANVEEAVREAKLDVEEGADMVMVKPATPYLDVVRRVKEATGAPVAAYHVSGEYSMLKAAAENGWIDERSAVLETLTSIRRAGADTIVTYYAKEAAAWLRVRSMTIREGAAVEGALAARTAPRSPRRDRQAADEPAPVELPARPRAVPAHRRRGGSRARLRRSPGPSGCWTSGSSARSRRSSTPARSATSRCWSRPKSTPRTRSGRRRSSTPTPASPTTTCGRTTSTSGSRSRPRPTPSSASPARSRS